MNRTRLLIIGTAVVIVAALVIAIVANSGSDDKGAAPVDSTDAAALVSRVTALPAASFATVGQGAASSLPVPVTGTPIAIDGKPEVLYVGAEYCPFCAAERWPLLIALSRFGTFANVGITHSSSTDVYPNTPTVKFHGSSYASDVLAFTAVEVATNEPDGNGGYTRLDTLTEAQAGIVNQLSPGGGIPFIDLGGKYLISGATYDAGVLEGKSAAEVVDGIVDPTTNVGKAVLGTANTITAALCQLTANAPAAVCNAPEITAIAGQLAG